MRVRISKLWLQLQICEICTVQISTVEDYRVLQVCNRLDNQHYSQPIDQLPMSLPTDRQENYGKLDIKTVVHVIVTSHRLF